MSGILAAITAFFKSIPLWFRLGNNVEQTIHEKNARKLHKNNADRIADRLRAANDQLHDNKPSD